MNTTNKYDNADYKSNASRRYPRNNAPAGRFSDSRDVIFSEGITAILGCRVAELRPIKTFFLLLACFFFFPTCVSGDACLVGLSGTMLVPGLDVLPQGAARAAAHLVGTDGESEGSFKGVFAFTDDSEIAIMKRFVSGHGKLQYDPVFSAKYKVRPNTAVAAVIDTTEGYKDSFMLLTGTPGNRVVLGVGANMALDGTEKYAHFGRYPDSSSAVEPLFFIFGASLNIDPDTLLTMDYAGNDFVIGLRHHIDESMALDFGYYPPDRLIQESRYCLGANFGF